MNQSAGPQTIKLTLNPDVVPFAWGKTYQLQIRKDNGNPVPGTMVNGEITLSLSGGGITALSIDDLAIQTQFQDNVLDEAPPLPESSYSIDDTPLGQVTGMIISMGASLTNAYIRSEEHTSELQSLMRI